MGNVATRKITKGEIICVERPILMISNDSYTGTVYIDDLKKVYASKFKQWPEEKQKQLMSLNYQSVDRENSPRDKVFAKFLGILRDSCYPNSEVYYSEPYLRVFAVKEIMEGEEICFSYKGDTFLGPKDLSSDTPPSIQLKPCGRQ